MTEQLALTSPIRVPKNDGLKEVNKILSTQTVSGIYFIRFEGKGFFLQIVTSNAIIEYNTKWNELVIDKGNRELFARDAEVVDFFNIFKRNVEAFAMKHKELMIDENHIYIKQSLLKK